MMNTKNLALVILMSLGVTACSVGSGNGSSGNPVENPKQNNVITSSSSGTQSNSVSVAGIATPEKTSAVVKKLASTYFADKTESYTYKYLVTEEGKAKFAEALKTAPATIANCSTGSPKNPSICSKSTAPGTILAKSESAYGGYAVIRETYTTDDKGTSTTTDDTTNADLGIPTNSFIYYVNTPTTSKSLVTNATYNGQVSYSRKNAPGVVTSTRLKLTVEGDTLTGLVDEVTGSGKTRQTMKFENGVISEQDNTVVVNGETTFLYANGSGFDNAKKEDFKGTFKGQFAGDSAQQVVGTFESTSTEKDQSVQGAFSATK